MGTTLAELLDVEHKRYSSCANSWHHVVEFGHICVYVFVATIADSEAVLGGLEKEHCYYCRFPLWKAMVLKA